MTALDERQERLFLKLRAAMERVSENFNTMTVDVPEGINVTDEIKRIKPMWYVELMKIETGLNSYDHTEDQYQALCDRYVKGWTAIFQFVNNNYRKR